MKKLLLAFALLASFMLVGCEQPPRAYNEVKEIGTNDTAFLFALDGDTDKNQKKFDSAKAFESPEVKIAAKRVVIPHKIIIVCPECRDPFFGYNEKKYKDVPTAKLITISRAPVSREWTATTKGSTPKNQAITVESNESIDFDLGAVITAVIEEKNTATFLWNYGGKQLEEVIDTDVRNYVAERLSASFGTVNLETGRKSKIEYFAKAKIEAIEYFKTFGITIKTFGSTEGMNYKDEQIQRAINKKFEAQMANEAATDLASAAAKLVLNRDAVILQQNYEIRKQEVENQKAFIAKWDNKLPTTMVGYQSTGAVFSLPPVMNK